MPVTQDRLTRLREFGLSEYAARSYLALLDLGIAEARDVSSISKVPQAKIYHVLEQLHEKGLVVILPEFPKKYAPVPFEEYLGRLYDQHTKAAEAIDAERETLAEMFRVMGDTDVGDRGFFTVIRGRRNVLAKIDELIGASTTDLLALGTEGGAARMAGSLPELARARERGVRVRIMSPIDIEKLPLLATLEHAAELRERAIAGDDQSGKVAIVISDATRAFLIHFVPDDGNLHNGKDIGVFTDQEAMVAAIRAIVEPHWAHAPTLAQRRAELLHGRAPEFTRVYTSAEAADAALAEAIARGVREFASVDGVPHAPRTPSQGAASSGTRLEGARQRLIRNVPDVAALDDLEDVARATPDIEVRHLRSRVVARKTILDDREAFFSLASGEIVIHTNSPAVVRTMRARFEALWESAIPLAVRREELKMFPDLQPGDVGFGRLFTIMRDAIVVADEADGLLLWNSSAETLFGLDEKSRGTLLGSHFAAESREELAARAEQARRSSPAGGEPIEVVGVRRDASPFDAELTLTSFASEGRKFLVGVVRDITTRKRSQQVEIEANQRILRTYERMREAFYALDRDFRFVYRNPAVRAMQVTRRDDEIDGKVLWEAFPDLKGTRFETEFRRAMETMQPARFQEHYARMGRWFEVTAYPGEDGLSVYFRDVSDIKRAEASAARASQLLHASIESSTEGVLLVGHDGAVAGHNERFAKMWGVADGKGAIEQVTAQLEDPKALPEPLQPVETRVTLRVKDGRVIEGHASPQRVGGQVVGAVWTFREARKK